MTLFLKVAQEFLIKNIQNLIQESKHADQRSTTYGALLGKRDLTLSATKRTILTRCITTLQGMVTQETDAANQEALVASITAAETELSEERAKERQAPASTEDNLLRLKAFIRAFHTQLEKLHLLDDTYPTSDPVFYVYHAIARYFATRLSDGVIKTNFLSNTAQWFSDHPSITPKREFLMAIDDFVQKKLQHFQNNLAGQKVKAQNFETIKYEAVEDFLELLTLKYETLRHDACYLNPLGQPLSITFLRDYLLEAEQAIKNNQYLSNTNHTAQGY